MAATHPWDQVTHDLREEMHDLAHFSTVDAYRQGRATLWVTLTVLPLLWGLDMMTGFITDSYEGYVAVWADNVLPGDAGDAVLWVGAITVLAGLLVAAAPHFGGDVLGVWFVLLAIDLFGVDEMAHLGIGMLALALCSFAMARMVRGDHRREA